MTARIQKIITKLSPQLNNWVNIFNKYIDSKYILSGNKKALEGNADYTYELLNIFVEITKACIEASNFKDQFEFDNFTEHIYGPELIINSLKTKTVYYIGFDNTGIYLRTYLKHGHNVKHMDDAFWRSLLSLEEFGRFELVEHERPSQKTMKEFSDILLTKKSIIFKMLRNYFMNFMMKDDTRLLAPSFGSLGDLQITWNDDFGMDKIVEEICQVFKIIYKLNYELWKIDDVKLKKQKLA